MFNIMTKLMPKPRSDAPKYQVKFHPKSEGKVTKIKIK